MKYFWNVFVVLGALIGFTGCSFLQKLYPKKGGVLFGGAFANVSALKQKKDYQALASICRKARNGDKRKSACQAFEEVIAQVMNETQCQQATAKYEEFRGFGKKQHTTLRKSIYYAGNKRIAACGLWSYLFENSLTFHRYEARKLLEHLTKKGLPVEEKLLAWMEQSPSLFKFFQGRYASGNVLHYFRKKKRFDFCGRFLRFAKKTANKAKGPFIRYFHDAHCKQAERFIAMRLSSSVASARRQACYVLGKLGSQHSIRKLRIVASTDSAVRTKTIRRGGSAFLLREFYVRKACRAAIGKVMLRQ